MASTAQPLPIVCHDFFNQYTPEIGQSGPAKASSHRQRFRPNDVIGGTDCINTMFLGKTFHFLSIYLYQNSHQSYPPHPEAVPLIITGYLSTAIQENGLIQMSHPLLLCYYSLPQCSAMLPQCLRIRSLPA